MALLPVILMLSAPADLHGIPVLGAAGTRNRLRGFFGAPATSEVAAHKRARVLRH